MKNLYLFFTMKKTRLALIPFATLLLAWCFNWNSVKEIDAENWVSNKWLTAEEVFNNQIEQTQYIIDLDEFLSYEILSEVEDKPYTAEYLVSAKLDQDSAIQWGLEISQNKVVKAHNLKNSEISFDVEASVESWELDPFALSWNISLLYQDEKTYANLHNFWLYMWEDNMTAKMYSLLLDMIKEKWIDLEMEEWAISSVMDGFKLSYLVWSIENMLKEWDVKSDTFTTRMSEFVDAINSYVDLWIYVDGLTLKSSDNFSYSELSDWSIQKSFTWSFEWTYSSFDMSFVASKKWMDVHFYNIKRIDANTQTFNDLNIENFFSIQEDKKSEYKLNFWSVNWNEKVANIEWTLKYSTPVKLSAIFELIPENILTWQKISWNIDWKFTKKASNWNETVPELTWTILLLSELLSSL